MITAQLINKNNNEQGFTLIELLIVIGILAVLMGIVLVAINPAKQFRQANDTKRRADVNAILNAIDQYAADNKGSLPATLAAAPVNTTVALKETGGVDVCKDLVTKYLAGMPADPTLSTTAGSPIMCEAGYNTGYSASVSASDNRVTISASSEVNPGTYITVTR